MAATRVLPRVGSGDLTKRARGRCAAGLRGVVHARRYHVMIASVRNAARVVPHVTLFCALLRVVLMVPAR